MACDAMLGCLRLSVFNFSFLCCAVLELLDQTGYTRIGEPFPDLHACVQPEGDCHHPTAQGQDPSAPEELSVSPFLLPEQCPLPHRSLVQFSYSSQYLSWYY